MQRRQFLYLSTAALAELTAPAFAQSGRRARRVGFLSITSAEASAAFLVAFREGMGELGWTEPRDYVIEARYGDGNFQAGPGLADQLVAIKPDLLLTTADTAIRLLAQRTKAIPIVFAIGLDPLGTGLVASLNQPGGNTTGLTALTRGLSAKRLQLLKEAMPSLSHILLLYEPNNLGSVSNVKEIETAGTNLEVRVSSIGLAGPADIEPSFKRGVEIGTQGCIVAEGFLVSNQRVSIVENSLRSKIPTMFESKQFVEIGGLMSYSASHEDNFRRSAVYVDKIFKGANPGELPIQQPTKFDLLLNQKSAKEMNMTFPNSFLVQVNKHIE